MGARRAGEPRDSDVSQPPGPGRGARVESGAGGVEISVQPPTFLIVGHSSHINRSIELEACQAAVERFVRGLQEHHPAAVATDIRPLD